MCGTLKYENVNHKIGQIVVAHTHDGGTRYTKWLGHIREENGPPKLPHERVKIQVDEYTEAGVSFKVPPNMAIDAYLIKSENYPDGQGVFIITRDAHPEELARCPHLRHPKFTNK